MFEQIKKNIDLNEYISFDIFDTLVFRNILNPTDLFYIMEKNPLLKNINNFHDMRILAEKDSRKIENNMETTIDLIYEQLNNKLSKKINIDKIKHLELDLEKEFIVINPFMKKVYDYALKKKKKIFIISDMYLDKKFLDNILKKLGYSDYKLYVSSDCMKTKANMDLYKLVWEDNNIDKKTWLHIGDNIESDINNAKSFGINTFHYPNVTKIDNLKDPVTSIADSIIRGIQKNFAFNDDKIDYWTKFGYLYASPIYFGFTNWLYKYTQKYNNIYFLARDGYIPKKIYEIFKKQFNLKQKLYYLYSSRATYQIATFEDADKEKTIPFLIGLTDQTNDKVSIKDILDSINLNYKKYTKIFGLFNFDDENDTINYSNYMYAEKFLSYIYDDIISEIKKIKNNVLEYLNQEKVYENINDMCIVDVGWNGSIQNALKELINHNIFGFYFGTNWSNYKDMYYNSLGYMFDRENPIDLKNYIYEYVMMYEFLFSAPHGTTLGFEKKDNKIIPLLDKLDNNITAYEKIESSSIEIIKEYLKYYDYVSDIKPEEVIKRYQQFIIEQKFDDLKEFVKIENSIIYHNKKESYVKLYKKKDIIDNKKFNIYEFDDARRKSMWKYAYFIEDAKNEEEYNEVRNYIKFNYYRGDLRINKNNLKKVIKNPKKFINILKRKFSQK